MSIGLAHMEPKLVVKRPALRWHGGKWKLAPWIIEHLPPHKVYVEPFGGAASVLLRKSRVYAEVYNDLDDEVVNLFKILREKSSVEHLIKAVRLTPFARKEFRLSHHATQEPIERARRLIVRSFMGFGSDSASNLKNNTGFRNNAFRQGTTPANDFANFADAIDAMATRFMGVIIESRPALQILRQYDSEDTLFYCDPPYIHSTRSSKKNGVNRQHGYAHEMNDSDHSELLEVLNKLQAKVVLSGYPHPLYDDILTGWHRVERVALADGARKRTEVLWINPQAVDAMCAKQPENNQEEMFA